MSNYVSSPQLPTNVTLNSEILRARHAKGLPLYMEALPGMWRNWFGHGAQEYL
jgi:hypothetical protein